MLEDGYKSIGRACLNDPIASKPTYFSVWVYLRLKANHADGEKLINNENITIKRGSWLGSINKIAEQFGMSRSSVSKILDYLEKVKKVNTERTRNYTIFHILDYEYDEKGEHRENTERTPSDTNNKNKNNNKGIKEKSISVDFESFWSAYGRIGNKQQSLKAFNKAVKEGADYETICRGLDRYQTYCREIGQEQRFIKHASTWLNNRGWEDDYTVHRTESKDERRSREQNEAAIRGQMRALYPDF